jgi:hypothetical protein
MDLIWFDLIRRQLLESSHRRGLCNNCCHGEFVSHSICNKESYVTCLSTHVSTHHTGWIHELLKGYNLMSCMFACTSELLSGKVLLLCCALYLYRPSHRFRLGDNRHDLELMSWMSWSAFFADAFYWRKDWCCYMSVSDQKSCWLGCLCRAEGEDNCWSLSWACAKHHCTDVLHILW